MTKLNELTHFEKTHLAEVEAVKQEICDAVKNKRIPGVKKISDHPECFVVSLSSVMSTKSMNLSPDYWSATAQAKHVADAIASCKTATDISNRIRKMLETGHIEINSGFKNRYQLNPVIAEALHSIMDDDQTCSSLL